MDEFEINCEECGIESAVHAYDPPDFCPLCGRRTEPKRVEDDEDWYEDE